RACDVCCAVDSARAPCEVARSAQLRAFAHAHDLALISIADLVLWRRKHEKHITEVGSETMHTVHGDFRAVTYASDYDAAEHVALVRGDVGDGEDLLVRVHSECLTGDVFDSLRCDCGPQL